MSANLSIVNGKAEMFSGEGITPWHGMGTVVQGLLSAEEAITAASLNWAVALEDVKDVRGNVIARNKAVTRQDNLKVLSIVGDRYLPIQNVEAFGFFDEVVGGGKAVYTTAGALDEGRRTWILAKLNGNMFIDSRPDEAIERMVLLSNTHDGTQALMMQQVAVRVVCQNTLSAALAGAKNQIKIRHTANAKDKVNEAQRILKLVEAYYGDLSGLMAELDKQVMAKDEAETFIKVLIPAQDENKVPTRTVNIRTGIFDRFQNGAGNRGNSRYDMMNAITDYVDHGRSTRITGDGNAQESRFESAIFGSGAALKQRGLNLLIA